MQTHETYIQAIYKLALKSKALTKEDRATLARVKLTYGDKSTSALGVTWYGSWHPKGCCSGKKKLNGHAHPLVTISAMPGESAISLCETVIHELGHVLAGVGTGHGKEWTAACKKIGLPNARAIYTGELKWTDFEAGKLLRKLPVPRDGMPVSPTVTIVDGKPVITGSDTTRPVTRTCGAGTGTRGGKSRGPGSNRQLLYHCGCKPKPVKIRCASRELKATCGHCKKPFTLQE